MFRQLPEKGIYSSVSLTQKTRLNEHVVWKTRRQSKLGQILAEVCNEPSLHYFNKQDSQEEQEEADTIPGGILKLVKFEVIPFVDDVMILEATQEGHQMQARF